MALKIFFYICAGIGAIDIVLGAGIFVVAMVSKHKDKKKYHKESING